MSGPATRIAVHAGVYKDSLVLMQLQHRLLEQPGVLEAGAAMASAANLELLAAGGLLPEQLPALRAEDLLVVVRADSGGAADTALASLAELLARRPATEIEDYRPRSLDGAVSQLPEARWALVSVPGDYAPRVARESLDRGLNVFLYSDNVAVEDELQLKRRAARDGRMVLGPDCGTAIVAGTGLGFANHVRRGPIGLLGGSGTGLQAVSVDIHRRGSGISQVIGTGGRDLTAEIGGVATRQAFDLLSGDPDTEVIALVSKSPSRSVASTALDWAAASDKPVVVYFQGFDHVLADSHASAGVHLAADLAEVGLMAVSLLGERLETATRQAPADSVPRPERGLLRGLFAGGTLAAEALYDLGDRLGPLHSNLPGTDWRRLEDVSASRGHTILDLGADELTRGRLHPMIDQTERLKRLEAEAADPQVALILLDVVLGEGAHADPASEIAPVIREAIDRATAEGRLLRIVAIVVGTEDDPQDLDSQTGRLSAAGATVVSSVQQATELADTLWAEDDPSAPVLPAGRHSTTAGTPIAEPAVAIDTDSDLAPVDTVPFTSPLAAINLGLESFHISLVAQGARSVHVDWRPAAGGDARLTSILDRLRTADNVAAEVADR